MSRPSRSDRYNLTNLGPVYLDCQQRQEGTLAFEVRNGRGRFLFLMFFSDDDASTRDRLYLFMRNTQRMFVTKLYGRHAAGDFFLYLNDAQKCLFRRELLIDGAMTPNPFDFERFFRALNESIPGRLPPDLTIATLRDTWDEIKPSLSTEVIDNDEKTKFRCFIGLPAGKRPRERTLRKLYLYWQGEPAEIAELIRKLKKENKTAVWDVPG